MSNFWLAIFAASGLAASAQSVSFTNRIVPPLEVLPSLTSTALLSMANLSGYVPDDKYKLHPGDRVSLQILEDREASKLLTITDSGECDVPFVGRVIAADRTCKQLADELKTLLEKNYYHRATVVLALDTANKVWGRVYLTGQIKGQGVLEMQVNDNLTVAKAILRAGGPGDFAKLDKVKLVRRVKTSSGGSTNKVFILNVAEMLKDGRMEKDILLEPEDFIIVPTSLIKF